MSNYPVPYRDDDQRLDDELLQDVRTALLKRGFPDLTKVDYGMLEVMLVRFVYAKRRQVSVTIADLRHASCAAEGGVVVTPAV